MNIDSFIGLKGHATSIFHFSIFTNMHTLFFILLILTVQLEVTLDKTGFLIKPSMLNGPLVQFIKRSLLIPLYPSSHLCTRNFCIFSLPFPAEDSEDEDGGGDSDRRGPGHPGTGKGLSREQKSGLDMVKHVMLSLDEEDGLDQIYTFRLEGS